MASDSSSGFRQGYHTFLYGHIKYNREGGRKNKRTNMDLGQLQAQEREFYDTLHSSYICRLLPTCILRETSTKATRNANSSLTVFPHCLLLLIALPLDCYLTPTGLFYSPLSTASLRLPFSTDPLSSLGPSFPPPLPVSREISHSVLCVGFAPKQTKRFSDRRTHTHTHTHTPKTTNVLIVSVLINLNR